MSMPKPSLRELWSYECTVQSYAFRFAFSFVWVELVMAFVGAIIELARTRSIMSSAVAGVATVVLAFILFHILGLLFAPPVIQKEQNKRGYRRAKTLADKFQKRYNAVASERDAAIRQIALLENPLEEKARVQRWREMLMRHTGILTDIKDRSPKEISNLEDWRTEATAAVNKAAQDIEEEMGASYATRFVSTAPWKGQYTSGNVNNEHAGCRMNLESYLKNLRIIFDGLGN